MGESRYAQQITAMVRRRSDSFGCSVDGCKLAHGAGPCRAGKFHAAEERRGEWPGYYDQSQVQFARRWSALDPEPAQTGWHGGKNRHSCTACSRCAYRRPAMGSQREPTCFAGKFWPAMVTSRVAKFLSRCSRPQQSRKSNVQAPSPATNALGGPFKPSFGLSGRPRQHPTLLSSGRRA